MRSLLFSILITLTVSASAATGGLVVLQPAQQQWHPKAALPPGAFSAVLRGDPPTGAYDFVGKFPAHFTVPMHWHTHDVHVVMTRGSMTIQPDGAMAQTIEEGGYFFLPGGLRYVASCEQPCNFLAHGEQPFDISYSDPADDPRSKVAKP